jgi:hypothetical protein
MNLSPHITGELCVTVSQVKCLLIFFNTHRDVFGSGSAKHLHNQEANDTAIFFKNQMGNNLDAYRAAIGLFHACKMSLNIGYDSCKKHEPVSFASWLCRCFADPEPNTSLCVLKKINKHFTCDVEKSKITNRNTTYKQFAKCTCD